MSPLRPLRVLRTRLAVSSAFVGVCLIVIGSVFAASPARTTRLAPREPKASPMLAAFQDEGGAGAVARAEDAGSRPDRFEKAPLIEAGRLYRGILEGGNEKTDVDVYTFEAPGRSFAEVTVALDAWDASTFATRIAVYDANLQEVTASLHTMPERVGDSELVVAKLRKGGIYYVAISGDVTAPEAQRFAEYRFAVHVVDERTNEPSGLVAPQGAAARSMADRQLQLNGLLESVKAEIEASDSTLAWRLYEKLMAVFAELSSGDAVYPADTQAVANNLCFSGSLDATDPTFNRPLSNTGATGFPSPCTLSGSGTAVRYDIYEFNITGCASTTLDVTLCGPAGCAFPNPRIADTVLAVYSTGGAPNPTTGAFSTGAAGAFNASAGCTNLVAAQDDLAAGTATNPGGSSGGLPVCTGATALSGLRRSVTVSGAGNFTVVVTAFGNSGLGAYNLYVDAPGCTISQVSSCNYSISPSRRDSTSAGSSNTVAVTAGVGCPWTAVSNDSWITVTGGASGSGNGTVNYTVAANAGEARVGTVTIAGATFTVVQDAGATTLPCIRDALVLGNQTFNKPNTQSAAPGFGSPCTLSGSGTAVAYKAYEFNVTGCSTTTLTATTCGTSPCGFTTGPTALNDPVMYIYRTGSSITDTGAGAGAPSPFASGAPCTNLKAANDDLSGTSVAGGGSSGGLIACTDRANSTLAGLQTTIGAGRFVIVVAAFSNAAAGSFLQSQVGTFNLNVTVGAGCTITPVGAGCNFSISPLSGSHLATGGSGTIAVNAGAGCTTWTAVSNVPWVTVAPPGGSGSGSVTYTVAANSGIARAGTLTIAGNTFTVLQEAGSFALPCYRDALVNGNPTFNRPNTIATGTGVPGPCALSSTGTNTFYKAYEVSLPAGCTSGTLTATTCGSAGCGFATDPTGAIADDTVVYVYRSGASLTTGTGASGAFNPAAPCTNLVAANDDLSGTAVGAGGSSGGLPACADRPNSTLAGLTRTIGPGVFTVVVTSFSNADVGLFNLHLTVTGAGCTPTPVCNYSIMPTSANYVPAGGSGTINVTAQAGCGWTATTADSWITITSGAAGAGSETVAYTVAANMGAARTGTITVAGQTFTVTQDAGCSLTCPANITVGNTAGQCGANVTYANPTNTGVCGTITCTPASSTFFPVGTTTVNCTSTAGPACSFTVTVQDTQAPSVTCPANITAPNAAGQCAAVVTYTTPTGTDNCPGAVTVTCVPASGTSFAVGTTTVTCTANDVSPDSPAGTCTFSVTVQDTQAPAITCPANITQPNTAGQCSRVVTYATPTGTDNCPGAVTVGCVPASGSTFPVGTTTVTCTANDVSPDSPDGTCSFTVTIQDTQAPTVTCPANISQANTPGLCATVVTYATPTGTDNCPGVVTVNCAPASGSSFPVGVTTVTCTASDTSANSPDGTCTFTVTVTDTQAPTVTCPANITQPNTAGQCSRVVTYTTPAATDNCPGATVVCVPASGATFPVGTTTVTCTATDASANTGSCTFTVTIQDTQAPTVSCPANISQPNTAGQCSRVVTYTTPTGTDNCPGVVTVTCVPASGSTFPVGNTTVTCTANDVSPDSPAGTCSFTVTINDTQGPTVVCPASFTQPATAGQCSAVVTYATPAGADNCPGVTVSCVPASGSTFPVGGTLVTCTATDASGFNGSCSFTVTIQDTQAPTVTCPSNITVVESPPSSGSATVTYTVPTASDNCPGATVNCVPASGSSFAVGTTTVTCTATDASANTGACTFTVTVQPACTITCPANLTVPNGAGLCGANVNYAAPTTTGNCGTITCTPSSGSLFAIGTTTVNCSTTSGPTCSFTVTVQDTQAPTANCPAPITVPNTAGQCSAVVSYTATATDNCPGATIVCVPASGSTFPVGTTSVTCTVSDASANSPDSTCTFSVTVQDTQAPAITCPANMTVPKTPGQCSTAVSYTVPTATDNCPGATASCLPASGSTFPVGVTTVTCTATDASPNSPDTTCSFTITVTDTTAPVITCPANVTVSNDANVCSATVSYAAPTTSDNCPGTTVSCTPASGSTFPVGATTVNCTATDASNNTSTCSFTVTVQDTQAPVASCPAPITTTAAAGMCAAVVTYTATATDNCPGATIVCAPASGSSFPVGTTTVNCTASDASPNSPDSTCSFTVTVVDTQVPVITCPANITVMSTTTAGCVFTSVVNYPAPTATDNCAIGSVACVPPSGSTFNEGTTTVTCTATDTSGNTAACTFTVTVGATFGFCAIDDATGDIFRMVVDPSVSSYRTWRYTVAATGQTICGIANSLNYVPGIRLVASDSDFSRENPTFDMQANFKGNSGTVTVRNVSGTIRLTLRDRNLLDNICP